MVNIGVVSLVLLFSSLQALQISDLVKPCSFKDPQKDDCMTKQARTILPFLVEGIQEWEVPKMSPIVLTEINIIRSGGPYLSLNLQSVNSSHHGWKNMMFQKMTFDPKNLTLDATLTIDHYNGTGPYVLKGHVIQVPIYGTGTALIKTRDLYETVHMQFEKETKDGSVYLKPVSTSTNLDITHTYYNVKNLFGSQILSNLMNEFLNANNAAIYLEVKPYIEEILSEIIQQITSNMLSRIPLKELFTDVE